MSIQFLLLIALAGAPRSTTCNAVTSDTTVTVPCTCGFRSNPKIQTCESSFVAEGTELFEKETK